MVNDRLGALKAVLNENDNYEGDGEITINIDGVEPYMVDFYNEVEQISQSLDKIVAASEEVRKKHSYILSAPSTDDKVKLELEDLMAEIKRLSSRVRQRLKTISQDIDQQELVNSTSAEFRIRKTQHSCLLRRFVDIMTNYNLIQTEYRDRCKDRIKRQLEITGNYKTDDEIEEMLESGNPAIFTQGIVIETQKARQTLADIEDRHADIIKLEKSIKELHDMFMDMAMLVENQGAARCSSSKHSRAGSHLATQSRQRHTRLLRRSVRSPETSQGRGLRKTVLRPVKERAQRPKEEALQLSLVGQPIQKQLR